MWSVRRHRAFVFGCLGFGYGYRNRTQAACLIKKISICVTNPLMIGFYIMWRGDTDTAIHSTVVWAIPVTGEPPRRRVETFVMLAFLLMMIMIDISSAHC